MNIGWRFDRNDLSLAVTVAPDRPGREGCGGERSHPPDWSDELNEIAEIVGAKIQNWPAACLEEKIRIRVPVLHAVVHDMGRSGDDVTDQKVINARPVPAGEHRPERCPVPNRREDGVRPQGP